MKASLLNPAIREHDPPDTISSITSDAFCAGVACIPEEAHLDGVIVNGEELGLSP